jgi:hypothetical protein
MERGFDNGDFNTTPKDVVLNDRDKRRINRFFQVCGVNVDGYIGDSAGAVGGGAGAGYRRRQKGCNTVW